LTVERESPEATICGQLLIVRNTLSLLPRPHSSSKSPHTGLFSYFFVFADKTNNLDTFYSRPRATVNPPQSPNATRFPLPFPISRRRHDLVVAEAYTSSPWR
jgi:hypothetical protein